MKLADLLERLPDCTLDGRGEVEVTGVTHDSRAAAQGQVFAALPGANAHGIEFLDQALAVGAAAVLTDRERPDGVDVPWLRSASPRPAMAHAAWALAGDPQDELQMVAVTGTNGKSTTAHLVGLILNAANTPAAFMGTLGYCLPSGDTIAAQRTTPEASDLAPLLRRTVSEGGRAVAMEVSSHALMQDRIAGLLFQVATETWRATTGRSVGSSTSTSPPTVAGFFRWRIDGGRGCSTSHGRGTCRGGSVTVMCVPGR